MIPITQPIRPMLVPSAVLLLTVVVAACNGDNGGTPAAPSPPGGGQPEAAATIRITSGGVEPREVSIAVGQRVRFVNDDSRPRQIQSNPHLTHTDCPPLNQPGVLTPGQSGLTGAFTQARVCGFHDHATDNVDERFRGRILVGGAQPGPDDDDGY